MSLAAVFAGAVVLELATGHYADLSGYTPRTHGGFFVRGLWGLITLGTEPRQMTVNGLSEGDNSIVLLINGVIVCFMLLGLGALWIWGIRDAANVARARQSGEPLRRTRRSSDTGFAAAVLLPVVVLLLAITALPVVFGILIAFTNYNRTNLPPTNLVDWVGFDNFALLLTAGAWGHTFFGVLGWTILWALLATATTYGFGFLQAAILQSDHVRHPKVWRSIFILPWAVPAMISALVFRSLFNGQFGPISQFLLDAGITQERVMWLTDPNNPWLARGVALAVGLWLGFPYFMALISGALTNISPNLYEAATLDGASSVQAFRAITLPLVWRTTAPLVLLAFIANFNNFGVIYFLTQGGPANPDYRYAGSTDLLITWLYTLTLDNGLYDVAAVMSIMIFVLVGSVTIWNLRRSKVLQDA
ncbi:MAG TPA: sugar ABC transporter permease [Microbacterium sp.]|nr:sugar ABC transporter permease [Microbacterium sp.]